MIHRWANWRDVDIGWRWRWFSPREMADRHCGALTIDTSFMDWLSELRDTFGRPMSISSGYRTAEHQYDITGRRSGAHVDAQAVDVRIFGEPAYALLQLAMRRRALGIGVAQLGIVDDRYLHIDRWVNAPEGLRPRVWSY